MKTHTIKGAGGDLHVREYGKMTGIPILWTYGWSQAIRVSQSNTRAHLRTKLASSLSIFGLLLPAQGPDVELISGRALACLLRVRPRCYGSR